MDSIALYKQRPGDSHGSDIDSSGTPCMSSFVLYGNILGENNQMTYQIQTHPFECDPLDDVEVVHGMTI